MRNGRDSSLKKIKELKLQLNNQVQKSLKQKGCFLRCATLRILFWFADKTYLNKLLKSIPWKIILNKRKKIIFGLLLTFLIYWVKRKIFVSFNKLKKNQYFMNWNYRVQAKQMLYHEDSLLFDQLTLNRALFELIAGKWLNFSYGNKKLFILNYLEWNLHDVNISARVSSAKASVLVKPAFKQMLEMTLSIIRLLLISGSSISLNLLISISIKLKKDSKTKNLF